jgi:hypothetical protein
MILNSEFLLFYNLKPKWRLKGGASFLFKEYTLNTGAKSPTSTVAVNDRFRNKSLALVLGVNYFIN